MNLQEKNQLMSVIGGIYNSIWNDELKDLLVILFKAIDNNTIDKLSLDVLKLFDYDFISNPKTYYNIKDIVDILCQIYDINKYGDIINIIRVSNGLSYDNSYLEFLNKKLFEDVKLDNNRLIGLKNLLNDNNLVYNNIGTRINILSYLIDNKNDIRNLNIFQVDNTRLNDTYKHLVFKNDKKLNYTKLYFINNDIVLSTLKNDSIVNVIYTFNDNINYIYGGSVDLDNNNIHLDIKSKQYTYVDNDLKTKEFICDLINLLKLFDNQYNDLDLNISDLNDNNIFEYISILNKNYDIFYRYDKLQFKYEFILKTLKNLDDFKSNDLDLLPNDLDSYDTFKYSFKEHQLFSLDSY